MPKTTSVTIEISEINLEVIERFRKLCGESTPLCETIEQILVTWCCDTSEALPKLEQRRKDRELRRLEGLSHEPTK